jgi:hypothetical protein
MYITTPQTSKKTANSVTTYLPVSDIRMGKNIRHPFDHGEIGSCVEQTIFKSVFDDTGYMSLYSCMFEAP